MQMSQKNITEHRKSALKIPNCFYKIFKNNDEDCQHRIASMDINMWVTLLFWQQYGNRKFYRQ